MSWRIGSTEIRLGRNAGNASQGESAVAVGYNAGSSSQGVGAVAVGTGAGNMVQGQHAVAIGFDAAHHGQGECSVAIGANAATAPLAGEPSASHAITINATGGKMRNAVDGSLMIKPMRNTSGAHVLTYNAATGEITYSSSTPESKENIKIIEREASPLVAKLVVKEFNYKNKNKYDQTGDGDDDDGDIDLGMVDKEETHFGFMADEVYAIDPTLVYDAPDGTPLDIKWNNIVSLLVLQNQANQVVIDELVLQNQRQQDQIDDLIRRLAYIMPADGAL